MAGLAAVTSRIQLFATCRGADHAAADRRAHGGDDRLHLARPLRRQHRLRLAAARIHADGHLAGRGALPPALRLLRRIRDHHERAVGDRPLRLQGRLLPDGRLPAACPLPQSADPDHLRGAERRRHEIRRANTADYNFCASFGINDTDAVRSQRRAAGGGDRGDRPRCAAP